MSDPFKKVQSGDPLQIPARAYNAFIDAAHDFQQRTRGLDSGASPGSRSTDIIRVRNDSGGDRQRFEILGIGDPIITPTDNVEAFKNQVAFVGETPAVPDHLGRFVILLEPIADGKIGQALVAGVCPVMLDVPDEDHPYRAAEVIDGDATALTVGLAGSATILWRESGTGTKWAVVRLGNLDSLPPFALDDCREELPTQYVRNNLEDLVDQVIRVGEGCFRVRVPDPGEIDECTEVTCVVWDSVHETCCQCYGEVLVTLDACDGSPTGATVQIAGSPPSVGAVIRRNHECFEVTSVDPCDDNNTPEELDDSLVFGGCASCDGLCFDLIPCTPGVTLAIRGPNLQDGQFIQLDGACYHASLRTCDGSEDPASPTLETLFGTCEDCRESVACGGPCSGLATATGSGSGPDEASACQAAIDDAIANAKQASDGRGIDVCSCTAGPGTDGGGTWSCWAVVCYSVCCPEGTKQLEVVTNVECVDNEMVLTLETICASVPDCPEACP
jgi:hypothetical protein